MSVRTGLPVGTEATRLLCEKGREDASGILHARRGKLRRLFCLRDGKLVFAASNVIEEQLPDFLHRHRVIDLETRESIMRTARDEGASIGRVLLSAEILSPEVLSGAQADLAVTLLSATVDWPDGEFRFEEGTPALDGEITMALDPLSVTMAVARSHPPSLAGLRSRVGGRDARPETPKDAEIPNDPEALPTVARYLLAACSGSRDVATIVKEAPDGEEQTLRALYGLLLAGVIEPASGVRRGLRGDLTDVPLSREECVKQLAASASDDHYVVLGLSRSCAPREVRDRYYALARRYHPDRFRAGDLQDLLPRFEEFFSRVTSAYNTLNDPTSRKEFDLAVASRAGEAGPPKQSETAFLAKQNYMRGRALATQKRWNEALTFLENAVRMDGTQADYHRELGELLARNPRRRADAERHLLMAAELSPAHASSYVQLGQLYRRAGLVGLAARMFQEALRWDPTNVGASAALDEVGAAAAQSPEGEFLKPALGG